MSKQESAIDEDTLFEKRKIPSFGKFLKSERDKKKLSLEDLYRITKIQVHFLEALEADHFEALPVPVLSRGYIRSISEAIDISPEVAIAKYDDYLKQLAESEREEEERKIKRHQAPDLKLERTFSIALAITILLGIIIVILYFLFPEAPAEKKPEKTLTVQEEFFSPEDAGETSAAIQEEQKKTSEPSEDTITEETISETEALQAQPSEEEVQGVAPLNREDGVNFVLKFYILDETWLKVQVDDEEPRNFMLRNNTPATFYAKEQIILDIGRVSSTELIVNDINIEYPQPTSDVLKNFTINKETAPSLKKRETLLDHTKEVPAEVMEERARIRLQKELEKQQTEASTTSTTP